MLNLCAEFGIKMAQCIWRKHCQCIIAISLLSSLGKRRSPSFVQNKIPFTQGRCIIEIGPDVLEKKIFERNGTQNPPPPKKKNDDIHIVINMRYQPE